MPIVTLRMLLVLAILVWTVRHAGAEHAPIRVAIECEQVGRTKACPTFLLGFVDAHRVLLSSPRAGADVVVYATANSFGLIDRLHLRFVGSIPRAPSVVEIDVDLDTRAIDDKQRAIIERAFLRGIANFVGARYPQAVEVRLQTPQEVTTASTATSPLGVIISVAADGNYTERYRTATTQVSLTGKYIKRHSRALAAAAVKGGINQQPALTLDDGTVVSLDSKQWSVHGGGEAVHSLNNAWSVGMSSYATLEDPKAQYVYNWRTRVAVEWDLFRPDDPRGNRLGVFYHLGWRFDRYNLRNEIGERFAQYPMHGVDAVGSVRHDSMFYGLTLESDVQLNHPKRRHMLTATPFVTFKLGTHVDLDLKFSITWRELPQPDASAVDPADYEQLSRLSYAEPLVIGGSIGLTFHWDPTNGVRNDRIESI